MMINLTDSNISVGHAAGFIVNRQLLPPMGAPEWESAITRPSAARWIGAIRSLAEVECVEPLPPLSDELYACFYRTGERLSFERVYFERRRRLARLAMATLTSDSATRMRFAPHLVGKIWEIMGEDSWALPAHVWESPSGKDPFAIDLFSAETANLMGELLNLFAEILPETLRLQICERLRVQFFENYLHPRREIAWKHMSHNWNAVCHQGVIGAALAVEKDAELVARILVEAGGHLVMFLGGFGGDGSTSEGPGYWSYGFGRFAELNYQIETATDGALSVFGANEHIRRIAQFAPALVLSNGYLVNFSDCARQGRLSASLLAYLGNRLDLPYLCSESVELYGHESVNGPDLETSKCSLFSLSRLLLRWPQTCEQVPALIKGDVFFPDYGAVVARGTDASGNHMEFAAKAGHNAEHHNHNDCGGFLLNINGCPAVVDIGAPEYTGDYFNSDETRYTFLAARSLGHSVPFVNGCEQSAGAAFTSSVLECSIDSLLVKFSVDLMHCYPSSSRCRRLVRTFLFEKSTGELFMIDEFVLDQAGFVESILMCEAPVLFRGGFVETEVAGKALHLIPGAQTLFTGVEQCSFSDHQGRVARINRLRFRNTSKADRGSVEICLRMA